jgi:hypothetical protein
MCKNSTYNTKAVLTDYKIVERDTHLNLPPFIGIHASAERNPANRPPTEINCGGTTFQRQPGTWIEKRIISYDRSHPLKYC